MEQRNLGASGIEVSVVGLGCNNLAGRLDAAASERVVHAALDLGITLFDTADVYPVTDHGAGEELLGRALGGRRDEVVVATKGGAPFAGSPRDRGGSRRYLTRAVEASLRRLGTDRIDLYQIHVPDPSTPVEETVRALDDLVSAGKILYAGCCNYPAWLLVESLHAAERQGRAGFVTCQSHYSLLERSVEAELVPAARAHGLGLLPYFPLASGLLTGKYRVGSPPPAGTRLEVTPSLRAEFFTEENLRVAERLEKVALERGRTLLELSFSWLLANEVVSSVIAGASTPEQLAANVEAAGWRLGADDLAAVDAALAEAAAPSGSSR